MSTSTLVETGTKALSRPLPVLVPMIHGELDAGRAAGIEHYRKAGELLLEAKAQVPRGEWTDWVARNFELSKTTAHHYMKLASKQKETRSSFETVSDAARPNRTQHPAWHEPVRESINHLQVANLVKEKKTRAHEQRLLRQLGLQLIDIGYKVLATKLHPDKGGSAEAMRRLNTVRAILKRSI